MIELTVQLCKMLTVQLCKMFFSILPNVYCVIWVYLILAKLSLALRLREFYTDLFLNNPPLSMTFCRIFHALENIPFTQDLATAAHRTARF